jgi:hypothetical protein
LDSVGECKNEHQHGYPFLYSQAGAEFTNIVNAGSKSYEHLLEAKHPEYTPNSWHSFWIPFPS